MEPGLSMHMQVPAPYDRIISQLILEDEHAEEDYGHEAGRWQSYARRVLNFLWKEIRGFDEKFDKKESRPKSLTPILQRQLEGAEDNYSPSVRDSVSTEEGKTPTIEQATHFYLRDDPAHPRWILNFRRNIIYIPEARWHLGTLLGAHAVGDPECH